MRTISGGVNSPVRAFGAVGGTPRFAVRGEGAYLEDADGTRYIDLCQSWGALLFGHARKEIVEAAGCELLYLPPYSPDLNPIEQAFSKVKGLLRKAETRTREALIEAIGQALSAVSVRDARGFFGHCGYHPMDQPP